MFPEQLYRKSNRDQLVTGLNPFFRQNAAFAAAQASLQDGVIIPNDSALLIQLVSCIAVAGAAQTLNRLQFMIRPDINHTIFIGGWPDDGVVGPAAGTHIINLRLDGLMIPPNWSILALGTFNAGVAVNSIQMSVAGLLIPRANISAL